jgi:CHAT domain-containing protein/tetratricopeptide (TPR) repeat protein
MIRHALRWTLGNLTQRVENLWAVGKMRRARAVCEFGILVARSRLDESDPGMAYLLGLHAGMRTSLGEFDGNSALLERTALVIEASYGPTHVKTAQHLCRLATLYGVTGRQDAAMRLLERVNTIVEQMPDVEVLTAQNLSLMATFNMLQARFDVAEQQFERSLDILERIAPRSFLVGQILTNLAGLHHERGRLDVAEPLLARACAISDRASGTRSQMSLTIRNNQARLYNEQGHSEKAEQLHLHVLREREKSLGSDHRDTLQSVANLAGIFLEQGRYSEGDALLLRAKDGYARAETDVPELGRVVYNLATSYWKQDRVAEAETLATKAVSLFEKAHGQDHHITAFAMNLVAKIYESQGRCAEAGELYERALAVAERTLGPDNFHSIVCMLNLADHYCDIQLRFEDAERLHSRAIEILDRTVGRHHPHTAHVLSAYARLLERLKRPAEAFDVMLRANASQTEILLARLATTSETEGTIAVIEPLGYLYQFLSLLKRSFATSPTHVNAVLDIVLKRKAVVIDAAIAQRTALRGLRHPGLRPKFVEMTSLRSALLRKTLDGPAAKESQAEHQQALHEGRERLERLESQLAKLIPDFEQQQALLRVDAQRIASALPPGTALVEFVHFPVFVPDARGTDGQVAPPEVRYAAFVVTRDRDVTFVDLGDGPEIEQLILEFRAEILLAARNEPDRIIVADRASPTGTRLREILFDRLLPHIGAATHMFLCPDGVLNVLPFDALPAGDGAYLAERIGMSLLASARDILRVEAPRRVQAGLPVVAADPRFQLTPLPPSHSPASRAQAPPRREPPIADRLRSLAITDIPGTRFEGIAVARRLGVTPLMGEHVLKKRIKTLESPMVLHIATHGFFYGPSELEVNQRSDDLVAATTRLDNLATHENPMLRSGLLLAGARTWLEGHAPPAEAEDGLLTAEDIAMLDLRGTELVVLSACNTALGELRSGDGVLGLRRAFVLAGARTLVMSLWEVDDLATMVLMERFYHNLFDQCLSRAEALRDAQRYLREELTIAILRDEWLTDDRLAAVAATDASIRERYQSWSAWCAAHTSIEQRPFREPWYWAGFVLVGDLGPLAARSGLHGAQAVGRLDLERDTAAKHAAEIDRLPSRTRAMLSLLSLLSTGPISYVTLDKSAATLARLPDAAEALLRTPRPGWIQRVKARRGRRSAPVPATPADQAAVRQELETLAARGLIEITGESVRVDGHVRDSERRLVENGARTALLTFAVAMVNRHLESSHVNVADYDETVRLAAEVGTLCQRTSSPPMHLAGASLLVTAGARHYLRGEFVAAETHTRRALEIRADALGWNTLPTVQIVFVLASILNASAQYGESAVCFERAIEIYAKVFRLTRLIPAGKVLSEVRAQMLMEAGHYSEAESLCRTQLAGMKVVFWHGKLKKVEYLQILGLALTALGRYEEAAESIRLGLSGCERLSGMDTTALQSSHTGTLAYVLMLRGSLEEAEALARRALAFHEQAGMLHRVQAAATLGILAGILRDKGDAAVAQDYARQSLRLLESVGPENSVKATCSMIFANLLAESGRAEEAESIGLQVVTSQRERRGRRHPRIAWVLTEYAEVLSHIPGRAADAETLCREALEISERSLGVGHPQTASARQILGEVLARTGRIEDAKLLFQSALTIRERAHGPTHSRTMRSRNHLLRVGPPTGFPDPTSKP